MGKLIFVSSVMNSGKTARLLQQNFDYKRIHKKTMLFKPALDSRETTIKSRNGLEEKCHIISGKESFKAMKDADVVFVDEAQFLTRKDINRLRKISEKHSVDVRCFGLKSDFKGKMFKGSKRLLETADEIDELSTMCLCGKKATMNLKYDGKTGKVIKSGKSVECGYEDMYMSVCYKHWKVKNIKDIG